MEGGLIGANPWLDWWSLNRCRILVICSRANLKNSFARSCLPASRHLIPLLLLSMIWCSILFPRTSHADIFLCEQLQSDHSRGFCDEMQHQVSRTPASGTLENAFVPLVPVRCSTYCTDTRWELLQAFMLLRTTTKSKDYDRKNSAHCRVNHSRDTFPLFLILVVWKCLQDANPHQVAI